MINGDLHVTQGSGRWSAPLLADFASGGIDVSAHDGLVTLDIPLVVALGNPTLLERVGVGPVSQALASEREIQQRRADRRCTQERSLPRS
jgi:hypothetical protein